MRKFRIGDIVKLSPFSTYNDKDSGKDNSLNPNFCTGTIIDISDYYYEEFNIVVKWSNGIENDYNEKDLDLIESFKKIFNYVI